MISTSREKGFRAKQEGDTNDSKFSKAPSSSSRHWSGFRNPRIVRVSRSFGGKDRHSKVCTIRGLRDRRIRLSVPTAIQLYELQDRLGLGQPSKVIDWLLDVTKNDIDKLPPLQIPQGFGQFHQQMLLSHELNASQPSLSPFFDVNSSLLKDGGFHPLIYGKGGIKINSSTVDGEDQSMMPKSNKFWDVDASSLRAKGKEVERDQSNISEKEKWMMINEEKNQDGTASDYTTAQNFFPVANHSSIPGLLNNAMPFNSYYHWEPSNLSLSQYGNHEFLPQTENSLYNNAISMQSSLAFPAGSHLFFCPPATMPSLFPTYTPFVSTAPETHDSRQINHFQLLSSTSQHNVLPNSLATSSQVKPAAFSLNVNPGLAHTRRNAESNPEKEDT